MPECGNADVLPKKLVLDYLLPHKPYPHPRPHSALLPG